MTRQLYLTRLDLLDDPHEGSYPKVNCDRIYAKYSPEDRKKKLESNLRIRKSLFINCWRYGNHESEAMWKLYCPNNEGVAIQTTYQKLRDSLNDKSEYLGLITYLDYETDEFKYGNILYPAMHKRKAFEHENEIRIVKVDTRYWADKLPPDLPPPPGGLTSDWDLEKFCYAIYVNPYAPTWYHDTVKELLTKLNLKTTLKWSKLKTSPFY